MRGQASRAVACGAALLACGLGPGRAVAQTPGQSAGPAAADGADDSPGPHQLRMSLGVAAIALGGGGAFTAVAGGVLMARHKQTYETDPEDRASARQDWGQARGLLIGGAIAAGLLIPTGIALVVTGERRRRKLSAAPVLGPGFAGGQIGLRF